MTVEEYTQKVQELLIKAEGKVNGVKLAKDVNVRMNISAANGNPAIIFCETDDDLNPTSILYCLELADIPTVRAMQMWLGDAMSILAHEQLQKADMKDTIEQKD